MKYINKLKNFSIPFDYPKFAIVISIAAFGFAASTHDTPCLSAQSTCSVGSDNEFTGNISLKGGTPNLATFDASGITADRTLTIPNNTGTLALTSDIPSSSYTPDAPFLKADGTGAATSGTATADAPFVSVDASGQLDSSATLTASTPLKSSASGQIAASDLDITTDITPGAALQEIRVNAGGTALEYFTASSGGAYTLIDSGNLIRNSTATYETFICWYGNTLDPTKNYLLKYDGGSGEVLQQQWIYETYVGLTGDCSSGTKNEWEPGSYHNYTANVVGTLVSGDETAYNRSTCLTLQSLNSSQPTTTLMNAQGQLTFSAVDNQGDLGLWSQGKSSGVIVNSSSSNAVVGQQSGTWSCTVYNGASSPTFSDLTGFYWRFEADTPANISRSWALYEIDY
tara:strand:- start:50 stop:1246 length:1197 start_codon:yes stop_codon:yes gene_type:complete